MSALLVAYALYCAYRDREATRARRHRNPYSLAGLLERNYRQALAETRLHGGSVYAPPNVHRGWHRG